jgi:PHD/YefM family antitoxin component YafN of YafNO toxin-antitoxin module
MYISRAAMFIAWMATMSVADARKNLAALIERSQSEAVFIERRGQRAAVLISPDR